MKKYFIIFFLAMAAFISCKKEVTPTSTSTVAKQANVALDSLMNNWYFWYKELPQVTLSDYADPYALMDALRYKLLDRWSFVDDYNSFIAAFYEGTFVGHGISIGLDASGKARIVMIYTNSPLYTNGSGGPGVRRGWIIKTLNGTDLASLLANGTTTDYNNLIGPATVGYSNTFVFQTPGGKDTTAVTAKASFAVNSVLASDTLNLKSGVTGHLVYDQFTEPSALELQAAFAFFKSENVKDLILDLRYNGGGILDIASDLASYIAGSAYFSTPFVSISYSDKKAAYDTTFNFNSILYPLNLTRLVVITTRASASASEEVINGVKPYVTVTTIGDTTNGKPTGEDTWQYSDIYIFAPITFEVVNSSHEGGFYAGFAPAKYVPDDITHDWSDRNELCLKEAIYFLENGQVSTKGAYIYKPSIQYNEKQAWMNNLFKTGKSIIKK
jgi:carboxyl-terminal processing protease